MIFSPGFWMRALRIKFRFRFGGFIFLIVFLLVGCVKKSKPDKLIITATWQGSNTEEMERFVTIPFEIALSKFKTNSTTVHGETTIEVETNITRDSLKSFLTDSRYLKPVLTLPNEVEWKINAYVDPSSQVVRYVLYSDQHSLAEIRKWNNEIFNQQLEASPKVITYDLVGRGKEIIEIHPSWNLLTACGLDVSDLTSTIDNTWLYRGSTDPLDIDQLVHLEVGEKRKLGEIATIVRKEEEGEHILYNSQPALEGIVVFKKNMAPTEIRKEFERMCNEAKPAMQNISLVPFTGPVKWKANQRLLIIHMNYSPHVAWSRKVAIIEQVISILRKIQGIASYVTETGYSLNGYEAETDQLNVFLNLDSGTDILEVENAIIDGMKGIPAIQYWLDHSMLESQSGNAEIIIEGNDPDVLIKTAQSIVEQLEQKGNIYAIDIEGGTKVPRINVTVERENLEKMGISFSNAHSFLQILLDGKCWKDDGRDLCFQLNPPNIDSLSFNLNRWMMKTRTGLIPVTSFVQAKVIPEPLSILRMDNKRYIKIRFSYRSPQALKGIKKWMQNPDGVYLEPGELISIKEL